MSLQNLGNGTGHLALFFRQVLVAATGIIDVENSSSERIPQKTMVEPVNTGESYTSSTFGRRIEMYCEVSVFAFTIPGNV